ncbi:methyl-accepting chemotaxis protein [Candidatus Magnetomoraceae bacterium gMMP-1]
MLNLKSMNLMKRVIVTYFSISAFIITIISIIVFYYSGEALKKVSFSTLAIARVSIKNQIINHLKERMADINVIISSMNSRDAFKRLKEYHKAGSNDINSKEYKSLYANIDPFFKFFLDSYGYDDIYIICNDHGDIIYSAARGQDMEKYITSGDYKDSGLAKLRAKIIRDKKAAMLDMTYYAPTGKPEIFIGAPVFDENDNISSIIAFRLSLKLLNQIIAQTNIIYKTGETILVGNDLFMRSDSKFDASSTMLKRKIDTVAAREALNNQSNTKIIKNYKGNTVLSSYSPLGLRNKLGCDFDWAIISEIDESEVFADITALKWKILGTAIILILFSCIAGYLSAKSIVAPIKKLSEKIRQITEGDLTVTISNIKSKNEIGKLIHGFGIMFETISSQTKKMIDGSTTLATSISQISSTAAEMAAIAAETSASVSEITSTVEEVRQTVHLSNEKASSVVEKSQKAEQISNEGRHSTENAVTGIKHIKEEMEYIAESIVKLSEQTQSIGQIISVVNDLADQSNLLSVNASIEAAKAGEHGKGFAVVAQEVKTLAEQSKEATNDVKSILNDIQKATSAAVMATERGSKAVETGVELSTYAGEAINILAHNITESAESAIQIASSSHQQLAGMDQLIEAMENIREASIQNSDGTQQLENAIHDLSDLANSLQDITKRFKM